MELLYRAAPEVEVRCEDLCKGQQEDSREDNCEACEEKDGLEEEGQT